MNTEDIETMQAFLSVKESGKWDAETSFAYRALMYHLKGWRAAEMVLSSNWLILDNEMV